MVLSKGSSTGAVSNNSAWKNTVANNFAVNYENWDLTQGDFHSGYIGNTQEEDASGGLLDLTSSGSFSFPAMGFMNL